jgi:oligopeptide/dipeptide ABC transporter ATP-binding protein
MLAIALATEPKLLLCDEPTTALDMTVQAQVLELLAKLRHELGLSLVFVSHDLAVVRQLCEDLVVMYSGRLVEAGPTDGILAEPLHPYTQGLLAATLDLGEDGHRPRPISGSIPEPGRLPSGCSFRPRCGFATAACAEADMSLQPVTLAKTAEARSGAGGPLATGPATASRRSACIHWDELTAR